MILGARSTDEAARRVVDQKVSAGTIFDEYRIAAGPSHDVLSNMAVLRRSFRPPAPVIQLNAWSGQSQGPRREREEGIPITARISRAAFVPQNTFYFEPTHLVGGAADRCYRQRQGVRTKPHKNAKGFPMTSGAR